ncbi:MAG TPA: PQQ-dependent sugar dehydrogenase [Thermoleophilaceae bacterium]
MLRRTVLLGLLAAALVPASAHAYTVPANNPFVGVPGARPEIYAFGLRNPFRWSFDRQTGDLTIGDVGQDAREEVDFVPAGQFAGANFGWDCFEADQPGVSAGSDPFCATAPPETPPVYAYDTSVPDTSHAVTGGVVDRDPNAGAFAGKYLFADFYNGNILSTTLSAGNATAPADTGLHVDQLVAFGQDAENHVYPVSLGGTVNEIGSDGALHPLPQSFSSPMYVTSPPGDSHRLFVVERAGDVRVLVDGTEQATPFLDIHTQVSGSGEQGMSTIAFPPDYATTGRLYVYYTDRTGSIRVDQFTRSAGNPNVVDPATEVNVLTIPHPGETNHYGGQMNFGPDGYLYISTGDGGSANDPPNNAQNLGVLLGKLLRIDPATPSPGTATPPPAGDKTPAVLKISRSRKQRVLKHHYVKIAVVANEPATITARGTVSIPGGARVLRLRSTRSHVRAGKRVTMHLRIPSKTLTKIRRALRHHRRVTATVTVTSRDAAGNAGKARRLSVRIVG